MQIYQMGSTNATVYGDPHISFLLFFNFIFDNGAFSIARDF